MKKITLLLLGILFSGFTANAANGFYVSGSSLKDANGNNFYIRGINNPHIWFDTDAYNALTNLAAKKVNTIRIVWTTSGNPTRLDQIIQRCIDLQMVPMVELHDGTGSDDPNVLNNMAYYYARSDVKSVMQKYQKYILINIANEWSSGSKTEWDWKEQYKTAVSIIRNSGITSTLVIDGPGYGQNSNGALWYGQELLNYDPQHNLLFSLHMYYSWNNSNDIVTQLGNLKYNNIPVIVGEFGYNYNNGNNNLSCKVDHTVVMAQCKANGYGYIPWSWKGNDASNAWLDLSTDWTNLTWWGNEVFNNANGINNTSTKASIFTSSSGCGTANGYPICCNGSSSDPDGDGWGYENNSSCIVQTIANGTYKISAKNSGLALDVSGSSTADGGSVVQWSYGGGNNQKWFVQNLGSGVYSIKNVNSGKALDVTGAATADGTLLDQWAYSGNNNQKWKIQYLSTGKFKIVSVSSNKCVDVYNASTAQGAQIDQWTCSGNDNQSFGFALLSTATSREEADLEEEPVAAPFGVYPNPSSSSFTVRESGTFDYSIQNTTGSTVEKGQGTDEIIAGKNLVPGIYFLQVNSAKGTKQSKLLKN